MDINKNYYGILGVIPSVELIVIKAAYKALAQLYHPDRYAGNKDEAHQKMVEINEAYSILSNPIKKKEYDDLCKTKAQKNDSSYFYGEFEDEEPTYDPQKRDWDIIVEYYPDISALEKRLSKLSWKLGYSYKAYLIESKLFEERINIANKLEQEFLKIYFGQNPVILDFARELIELGNKSAAKELNGTIKVLGSQNCQEIIHRILTKYNILSNEQKNIKILENIGCKVHFKKAKILNSDTWEVITRKNKTLIFKNIDELIVFTKLYQREIWCENKLDKSGYLFDRIGSMWHITDYIGNRKIFNSIQELEKFTNSLK